MSFSAACSAPFAVWMHAVRAWSAIQRILTARAASKARVVSEMLDWIIMSTLAQRERTGESVGENAVLVLKARNR